MARGKHTGGRPPLEPGSRSRTVALRVSASQHEQLLELTAECNTTPGQVLREALTEYLARRSRAEAAA